MAKQYEVIGPWPFMDHEPGERFWADIPPEQEERNLGAHIALVREPRKESRPRKIEAEQQKTVAAGDATTPEKPATKQEEEN